MSTDCQNCGGDGVVFGPTPGSAGAPWEYKCTECGGTGHTEPKGPPAWAVFDYPCHWCGGPVHVENGEQTHYCDQRGEG